MKNLLESPFKGQIYAVNPKETEVQGVKCYAKVDDLPQVDCALLCIAAKFCAQTVQDEYGIEAHSIIDINDIIAFLESEENRKAINAPEGILEKVYAYREKWGAQ